MGNTSTELGQREFSQQLLIELIANEINSAFIFLAVAGRAYGAAQFPAGNAAVSKAETIYVKASELARDSGSGITEQAIADGLCELRSAIDDLKSGKGFGQN